MPSDKKAKIETWLKPVTYAKLAAASHASQRWRICPFPVEEVIGRLRSAIEAASFWNLHEIDSQALLSHEGYAISPARPAVVLPSALWCASCRSTQQGRSRAI